LSRVIGPTTETSIVMIYKRAAINKAIKAKGAMMEVAELPVVAVVEASVVAAAEVAEAEAELTVKAAPAVLELETAKKYLPPTMVSAQVRAKDSEPVEKDS